MLMAKGVAIRPGVAPHLVIARLAAHFLGVQVRQSSHTDAAIAVLQDLDSMDMVTIDANRRGKILAVLATALGNFLTMHSRGAA